MTSIAPLRVAGLIEFHVFETEPLNCEVLELAQGAYEDEEVLHFSRTAFTMLSRAILLLNRSKR